MFTQMTTGFMRTTLTRILLENLQTILPGHPRFKLLLFQLTIFALANFVSPPAMADDADRLRRADEARGLFNGGIEFDLSIVDLVDGKKTNEFNYTLRAKDLDAEAVLSKPDPIGGQTILVKNLTLWILKNKSQRPVKVSVRDRMSGLGAVGDLMSMRYSKGYVTKLRKPSAQNTASESIYDLQANAPLATYSKVTIFLSKTNLVTKAEFPNSDGSILKEVQFKYENSWATKGPKAGKSPFISELIISENGSKTPNTIVKIGPPKEFKAPQGYFDIEESMKRNKAQ